VFQVTFSEKLIHNHTSVSGNSCSVCTMLSTHGMYTQHCRSYIICSDNHFTTETQFLHTSQ